MEGKIIGAIGDLKKDGLELIYVDPEGNVYIAGVQVTDSDYINELLIERGYIPL